MLESLLLFSALALSAETPWVVQLRPALNESAAPQTSYSLSQDDAGFIWLGTESGVYRFDGQRMVQLGERDGLRSDNAGNLMLDRHGRLWIGTWGGGLHRLDRLGESLTAFPIDGPGGTGAARIQSLHESADGRLWFGSADNGLFEYREEAQRFEAVGATAGLRIWGLVDAPDGALWVAADGGLGRWDGRDQSWQWFSAEPDNGYGFDHRQLRAIHIDQAGRLWVATRAGLGLFDPKAGRYQPQRPQDGSAGLIINRIVEDDGRLWLGTISGLLRFDPAARRFEPIGDSGRLRLLPTHDVRDLRLDAWGGMWLATRYAGLVHLNFEPLGIDDLSAGLAQAVGSPLPAVIHAVSGGVRPWLGTAEGLFTVDPGSPGGFRAVTDSALLRRPVFHLTDDGGAGLWLVTDQRLLHWIPGSTEPIDHSAVLAAAGIDVGGINDLAVDGGGRLYLSTAYAGLNRLDPADGVMVRLDHGPAAERLVRAQPGRISLDGQGRIWLASFDRHLFLYDPTGPDWRDFELPLGDGSGMIHRLIPSEDGNHWVLTSRGLFRFEVTAGNLEQVALLPAAQPEIRDALIDASGSLWLASEAGLIHLDPRQGRIHLSPVGADGDPFRRLAALGEDAFLAAGRARLSRLRAGSDRSLPLPVVAAVSARINDERLMLARDQVLRLPPSRPIVALELATPGLPPGHPVSLRYRLPDIGAEWQQASVDAPVLLGRLDRGDHRLEFQAGLGTSIWGPSSTLMLRQPAPWYLHPVALMALALLLLSMPWLLQRWRIARLNAQRESLQGLLAEQAARLGQQHQQLLIAEKMATLGNLTAGVAHEINNPVAFTHAASQNLERDLARLQAFLHELAGSDADPAAMAAIDERIERLRQHLATSLEGTRRIQRLVRDLRVFSRIDEAERKQVDLAENLQATLRLVQTRYQDQLRFVTDFQGDTRLACWPAQLNQVFMNLIVNACQALQNSASTDRCLTLRTRATAEAVQLEFEDNGPGIPPDQLDRIFEPFFTTKPSDQGTGMGLAISRGIVERHGGTLAVDSRPGLGCVFRVTLPRHQ